MPTPDALATLKQESMGQMNTNASIYISEYQEGLLAEYHVLINTLQSENLLFLYTLNLFSILA